MIEQAIKPSAEGRYYSGDRSIRQSRCEEIARQAPRSGALFFRRISFGHAKEIRQRDLKGAEHLLRFA